MNLYLNGELQEVSSGLNLLGLLEKFELPVARVAVELNKTVIKREKWPETELKDLDRIEVVHFVGGG